MVVRLLLLDNALRLEEHWENRLDLPLVVHLQPTESHLDDLLVHEVLDECFHVDKAQVYDFVTVID